MSRALNFGWLFAVLSAGISGGTAQAQDAATPVAAPNSQIITAPEWEKRPTGSDIGRVYPNKAQAANMSGVAVMRCGVAVDGRLKGCSILSETPKDYEFGEAVLRLAPSFKMKPRTVDGTSVEDGVVVIPVFLRLGDFAFKKSLLPEPTWAAAPTAAAFRAAYPADAGAVAGEAVVRCGFRTSGNATDCVIRSQSPEGKGFGPAAVALAKDFQLDFQPGDEAMLMLVEADISVRFPAAGESPTSVSPPRWRRALSPEAAERLFPAAASAASVLNGVGTLNCAVTKAGQLTDCRVVGETPADLGFGAAAVQAATVMALSPWGADGRPLEGRRLTVPIRLKLESAGPPTP